MNRALSLLGWVTLTFGLCQSAQAANWFDLQGNEPAGAKPVALWGFVQPTYGHNEGGGVTGLSGPLQGYNGQTAQFNLVAPDAVRSDQMQMLRADFGAHGVIPGTDERINYFILTELGNNGLTRAKRGIVSDASVTFNYIPGARIRAGLMKAPLGEEALQGVATMDYIQFSTVTDSLALERFVEPYQTARAGTAPGLANARIAGAVGGFRDVGVQVYDSFPRDAWEYAYAVMVGNGSGTSFSDNNSSLDVQERLQAAYVFGGSGPRRQDVVAYVWHQEGKRTFAGADYNRIREGVGFRYLKQPLRVAGEYMQGKGMILGGINPPFNDVGSGVEPVAVVGLDGSNKADGWYVDFGWSVTPKWEVDLRVEEFDNLTNSPINERRFSTWTVGLQHFFSPNLRMAINYDVRTLDVVNPSAIPSGPSRTNAQAIADSMDNRVGAQITWIF